MSWEKVALLIQYQKKDGTEKFITSSCLSSSLHDKKKRSIMTASQYAICKSIEQILREE